MPTNLGIHIPAFKDWLKTSTGKAPAWRKEREKRLAWYQKHLSEAEITLTRDDFATLVKSLWAVNIWQNKDYKVNQLIEDNGLETLRVSLGKLLHGSASIDERWDEFRASVKGFGPSSLSEILTFFKPTGICACKRKTVSGLASPWFLNLSRQEWEQLQESRRGN